MLRTLLIIIAVLVVTATGLYMEHVTYGTDQIVHETKFTEVKR